MHPKARRLAVARGRGRSAPIMTRPVGGRRVRRRTHDHDGGPATTTTTAPATTTTVPTTTTTVPATTTTTVPATTTTRARPCHGHDAPADDDDTRRDVVELGGVGLVLLAVVIVLAVGLVALLIARTRRQGRAADWQRSVLPGRGRR